MFRLGPDDFLDRLLAAHGAEDAFEPSEEACGGPVQAAPRAPAIDPAPVLRLLAQAERLCGIDDVRKRAAAAA